MRKFTLIATMLAMFISLFNVPAYAAAVSKEWLNTANVAAGAVGISYDVKANVKTMVTIVKGNEKYTYTLTAGKQEERFPLQLGNGEYTITVLENISGNKYKAVQKGTVKLNLADSKVVYLNSIQNISWSASSKAVQKAKELTAKKETDADKVKAIYDYVINNIKYDSKLATSVTNDYLPQIDRTLTSQKDICYGYASLVAAMLRSLDIPTKLVMGKSTYVNVYHAWNEVFLDNKWVIIDTTVDAGLKDNKKKYDMVKSATQYTTEKQY
ncbi:transglutaminase-like domain-containing protein [Paenibacillus eucommiae]|uniref:Transglutaminase-like domain-containing protein n=1 Tax=Paenibacillus eucommiae TaxID=1355755 RepID=A0ABS4ITQ6_9BACL|nr:transglutaminase-like domain-containing protein [Paenibacillus eucommiae]MBP1990954.1 hypothetical protein [Paenibacillus eucommiae]